jgi:hypothetical protein
VRLSYLRIQLGSNSLILHRLVFLWCRTGFLCRGCSLGNDILIRGRFLSRVDRRGSGFLFGLAIVINRSIFLPFSVMAGGSVGANFDPVPPGVTLRPFTSVASSIGPYTFPDAVVLSVFELSSVYRPVLEFVTALAVTMTYNVRAKCEERTLVINSGVLEQHLPF